MLKNCWVGIKQQSLTHSRSNMSNHISGIVVSVLTLSAVDCGFKSWSGQTKDNKISTCCFSTKHSANEGQEERLLAQDQM